MKLDNYIGTISGVIDYVKAKRRSKKNVKISFDEWNVWYHSKEQDKKILGGNWAMHAFLVAADVDVNMGAGGRQDRAGMGDLIVSPLAVGWHAGNWHWIAAVDLYLPTGRYDKEWLKLTLWYSEGNRLSYKPVQMKPLTVDSVPLKVRTF